eukprot:3491450-Alexandrium_andersonii.AAC.1
MSASLVGSEMCIRDRASPWPEPSLCTLAGGGAGRPPRRSNRASAARRREEHADHLHQAAGGIARHERGRRRRRPSQPCRRASRSWLRGSRSMQGPN